FYAGALNYGFAALGRYIGNVVTDYLATKYDMTPIDTYKDPKLLFEALEKTLGYGSVIVETRIIRSLRSQVSMPLGNDPQIRMGHPEDFEKRIYEIQTQVRKKKIS
ncbi:MAG: hypothetical protein ACREBS_07235, partial [Nitrososphaerales archaeon]